MRVTIAMIRKWSMGLALLGIASAETAAAPISNFTVAHGTTPGGGAFPGPVVVLTWADASQAAGFEDVLAYNLYRKVAPDAPYPAMPLNPVPIRMPADATALQNLLGRDGWLLVAKALTSPPPYNPLGTPRPFDPATIRSLSPASAEYAKLQWLARAKWKVAVAIGQGYLDKFVTQGVTYYYELRGLNARAAEQTLVSGIAVTAGVPAQMGAPPRLTVYPGDSRVLATWGEQPAAAGFHVYRSEAAGPWVLINESGVTARVRDGLDGKPLFPDRSTVNGLLDMQRWDPGSGMPVAHMEGGIAVNGPRNGVSYAYRICAVDLLGSPGPLSPPTPAVTPQDATRPCAPDSVTVTADDAVGTLETRWAAVTRDTEGHLEQVYDSVNPATPPRLGVTQYRLYRYTNSDDARLGGTLVATVPGGSSTQHITAIDNAAILRPAYGEQTFWYRVECEDAAGNVSARSAAVAGRLRDITPPAPPNNLAAIGFDDRIRVTWDLSPEPDVAGYLVYRSLCDAGTWPCRIDTGEEDPRAGPCNNLWVQVGYLGQRKAVAAGQPSLDDTSVPPASPLCYAYLVKVEDQAQNKSGPWPPDPTQAPFEPYVCQRLRDTTPPPPAVITELSAGDASVDVSWVGAPIQDIRAYYVYRSTLEGGTYSFVGGMTVERPPAQGQLLTTPLPTPSSVGCDKIGLVSVKELGTGTYSDTAVQPKTIYWYKVLGVDQSGNISDTNNAVPVSTFTFATAGPASPVIVSVTPTVSPCHIVITWSPAFDVLLHSGFMVLRSTAAAGPFRQVGSLVTGANAYTDSQVRRGTTYWYQVVAINTRGIPSAASPAKQGLIP